MMLEKIMIKKILQRDQDNIVSLHMAKIYLKIYNNLQDSSLSEIIGIAQNLVEDLTQLQIQNNTVECQFSGNEIKNFMELELPDAPIQEIISIKINDSEIKNFKIKRCGFKTFIQINFSDIAENPNNIIKILYKCGLDKKTLPSAFRLAILGIIADIFKNSSISKDSIEKARLILEPYINLSI